MLNQMIKSSNTKAGNIFTRTLKQYQMVAQQESYTIGDTAGVLTDLAGARPARIEKGGVNLFMSTDLRRPIELIDDSRWADIRLHLIYTYPLYLYYDEGNYAPNAYPPKYPKLYFYPIPAAAYNWEMYTWESNQPLNSVTDIVEFPDGYEEFWILGLAMRAAPILKRPISEDVRRRFCECEANIRSKNATAPRITTDPALSGSFSGLANWKSRTWN
jgi:hypothetical protein